MEAYQQKFLLGIHAMKSRNYQEAIKFFESAVSHATSFGLNPSDDTFETAYFNIAQSKKETSDFTGAVNYYLKSIKINPKRENSYLNLSECCFTIESKDSLTLAVKTLSICLSQFPSNKTTSTNLEIAHLKLGVAFLQEGNMESAKQSFLNAKAMGNDQADELINKHCN